MATVTVSHDGKEIEVELPEGYIHKDEIKDAYVPRSTVQEQYVLQTEMERRFKNWIPRDKAADDETIVGDVLKKHGKPQQKDGVDLESAKAEWRRAELDPLKHFSDKLLAQVRGAQLKEAASKAGFDERHVSSPVPGIPSYVETAFNGAFEYDADLGYFVARDAAGNRLAAQEPTTTRPYAGPEEFFRGLAKQDAWKPYLKPPEKNNGSGYQGAGSGVSSTPNLKRSTMTQDQKLAYIAEHGQKGFMALPS